MMRATIMITSATKKEYYRVPYDVFEYPVPLACW